MPKSTWMLPCKSRGTEKAAAQNKRGMDVTENQALKDEEKMKLQEINSKKFSTLQNKQI